MLWVTSKWYDYVAAYSLPDFKLIKIVPVGLHPEWLTIPPDGKDLYVACAGKDATFVVDTKMDESSEHYSGRRCAEAEYKWNGPNQLEASRAGGG